VSTQTLTAAPVDSSAAVHLRIDPPHAAPGAVPPESLQDRNLWDEPGALSEGDSPSTAGDDAADLWSQMRTQAHQLAAALRRRQAELDRREANLNAQAEHLEQESRNLRLWWQDQLEELARREESLRQGSAEQSVSSAEADASDSGASETEPALEVGAHREALLRAEALLADELAEVQRLREELTAAATEQRQRNSEPAGELDGHERMCEEFEHKRQALAREAERLEARRGQLERLREELRAAQRETLEIRLAAEEVWAQLSAAVPAASLTRAMGRMRQRLADQYRLASADLDDQKREIESLRSRLQQHHDRLATRQQDLQHWFERRQAELHDQGEQLAAREEELTRQRRSLEELKDRWFDDRRRLHAELRELLVQK